MTLVELEKKIVDETDRMYLQDKGGHWVALAIVKLARLLEAYLPGRVE